MHRANHRSHRVRMEAWRQWPLGGGRKNVSNHETGTHLTPTGLLMEGDYDVIDCIGGLHPDPLLYCFEEGK